MEVFDSACGQFARECPLQDRLLQFRERIYLLPTNSFQPFSILQKVVHNGDDALLFGEGWITHRNFRQEAVVSRIAKTFEAAGS